MERAPYFYSLQESYEKRRVQNDKGTQSVVNAKKKCVAVLLKESGRFGMTTDLWSFKFGVFSWSVLLVSTAQQSSSLVQTGHFELFTWVKFWRCDILVATDMAGRGLDIVINFGMPKTIKETHCRPHLCIFAWQVATMCSIDFNCV